ncbi:hypothetical protein PF005_g8277 [Phytophthora fragariae]|uniref:Uncharacterized protein n=2 Tax=Phytophthora TaxID=4783 RepID=A0A6A3SM56_9STRA|nr:hypothetical protein PF003_g18666 [Phytophthora fragariae]KAE9035931.1 hypothetical protein PR002_g7325 [Phytophthora rubi]KAE8941065.1 hypothetical protein PF009_g9138 [Phytophthora fragariae]KAE8999455.1 hypothetical protein PF011_g14624 [Phytophthora fragariae]KAE9119681.1 hypothetical protein PF007_g8453 [Phytophthora fragariae]
MSKARNSVTKDGITLLFNSLLEAIVENRCNMDDTTFQTNKGSKRRVTVRGSKNV